MTLKKIILMLLVLLLAPLTASAAPVDQERNGYTGGIYDSEYSNLPTGEDAYYRIDFADEEVEEKGFLEEIRNFNPITNTIKDQMNYAMEMSLNIIFTFNMMMSKIMISTVQFSMDTDIVNGWLEGLGGFIQNVTGISNYGVSGGLFGSMMGLAAVLVTAYAAYKIFVARSPVAGISSMFQTIFAIAISLFLFSNFVPMLTGLNTITTNLSSTVMAGGVNLTGGDLRTEDDLQEIVGETLWGSFVTRPYLILQYNTDNVEEIGESRINELLAMPPGEERQEFVNEIEVGERGNVAMPNSAVYDRISFTMVYSILNIVVSIPIFGLALMLLLFQAWFLIMAGLAPFILAWSIFPGQFGVIRRYAVELAFPLAMKFFVTAGMLFVFTLGFITYQMGPNTQMSEYYTAVLIQIPIYAALFFMQKRIRSIFSSGESGPFGAIRSDVQGLRRSLDQAAGKLGSLAKVGVAAATGGAGTAASVLIQQRMEKQGETQNTVQNNETETTGHTNTVAASPTTVGTTTTTTRTETVGTVNAEPTAEATETTEGAETTETNPAENVSRETSTTRVETIPAQSATEPNEPQETQEPEVVHTTPSRTAEASAPLASIDDPDDPDEPEQKETIHTQTVTSQPAAVAARDAQPTEEDLTPDKEAEPVKQERGENYSKPLASIYDGEDFDVEEEQQADAEDIAKGSETHGQEKDGTN